MLHTLKKRLYFVVAAYFAFWAKFVLWRWRPRIVVITGSSGKTTVLHLVEAQIGERAVYSHHANSAIGIPLHILGLKPNVPSKGAWISYVLTAPFKIFHRLPATDLYIVEADCDRPHEGAFLANLLKPEVVLWVSVYRTHSMNFDLLVKKGVFATHEQAIAHEFGNFAAATRQLVVVNGDQSVLTDELRRVEPGVKIVKVLQDNVAYYKLSQYETVFEINKQKIHVPGLQPKELGNSLQLVNELLHYLKMSPDTHYANLHMPPGRSNVLAGKRSTVLIDSTYNTGLGATLTLFQIFEDYPSRHRWLVMGDILELGSLEKEEHERLAEAIINLKLERVILLGPRTKAYTYPRLTARFKSTVVSFESPKEVLDYLEKQLQGGETILFKGGRFLEGVIEQLLANPADVNELVRREPQWVKRRKTWGLPH